jgi:hypothetical protein
MWIWFGVLFVVSIISFLYSFYNYVPFFARYRFISKLIRFIQAKKEHTINPATPNLQSATTMSTTNEGNESDDFLGDIRRQKDFVHWLQRDGVFLLHLLNSHAGEPLVIKCLEDLIKIYTMNYEEKPKLAERLLKNQFNFSK